MRPFIQLIDGTQFFFADPPAQLAKTIRIHQIATGLSREGRYSGHALKTYRVAEHCVILARYARRLKQSPALQFALLMHDAPEGLGIRDLAGPVKNYMRSLAGGRSAYDLVEDNVMEAVSMRYGIDWRYPYKDLVKEYDYRILLDEKSQNMAPVDWDWQMGDTKPLGVQINCWSEKKAYTEFMVEFFRLCPPGLNDAAQGETS